MTEEKKMNSFVAFLKLIRVENLLIIAATQYLFEYFIFRGLFTIPDKVLVEYFDNFKVVPPMHFGTQLSALDFFLLSLSTVMIAAAGYIINDYFDVKTDRINRPDTIIIDRGIKRRVAMVAHTVINIIGIGLGVYVGYKAGNIKLGLIHAITAGMLWFYSTNFKKMFFVGNIVVAFLAGLVPLVVAIYETHLLHANFNDSILIDSYFRDFSSKLEVNLNIPIYWAAGLGLFAFLTNLMREIVKDMEDFVGDMETGGETVPIRLGYKTTKNIVHFLNLLTITALCFVMFKFWQPNAEYVWYKIGLDSRDSLSAIYLFVLIILPLIVFSFMLRKSDSPKKYKKAGLFLKFVMLAGILYSFLAYYNFTRA